MIQHAGLIACWSGGRWRGVLVEGPSGAGKSGLALRAIDAGFRLVADDRTLLWTSAGRLFGRAPDALAGLIEIRGLDVARAPFLRFCEVALIAKSGVSERIPLAREEDRLGVRIPTIDLDLSASDAPAKLRRALDHFDGAHKRGI